MVESVKVIQLRAQSVLRYFVDIFGSFIERLYLDSSGLYVTLVRDEMLLSFLTILYKHSLFQFTSLLDLTCVDFQERAFKSLVSEKMKTEQRSCNRFLVVYNIFSYFFNFRVFVVVFLPNTEVVDSVTSLYRSANWLEREVWDMFGIFFFHHNDLRRILTDYGFCGFPLRKDFPLSGFVEVRYDDEMRSIVYEALELTQEFRFFEFNLKWRF